MTAPEHDRRRRGRPTAPAWSSSRGGRSSSRRSTCSSRSSPATARSSRRARRSAAPSRSSSTIREPRTIVVTGRRARRRQPGTPGERWTAPGGRGRARARRRPSGELLFRSGGRWRIASGERAETLEAPSAGVVHVVRPGLGDHDPVRRRARFPGRFALAGPTWGRLQIATGADGELRAQHVDVGAAGRDHRRRRADGRRGADAGPRRGHPGRHRRRARDQGAA